MSKYVWILSVLLVAGCSAREDTHSCWIAFGKLHGATTGKVLHCEIHDDGSVSSWVSP